MTVLPVATSKQHFGRHELSVTVRNLGDNKPVGDYVTIVQRTIKMWLYLAQCIESGTRTIPDTHNIPIDADKDFVGAETRCTVFNWSYTLPNQIGLTVHSDTFPQQALDVWFALFDTLVSFEIAPQTTPSASNSSAQAPTGSQAPATPKNASNAQPAVEGAIVATRAPSKNRQYADGQLLIFSINKVVMGTNKGSITYNLWGDLGKNFALKTVYKTKNGSDENSLDYIASKDAIVPLGLSVDAGKIEAHGDWKLTTKVAHGKNGKGEETEFFNVVSLVAV